MVSSHCKSIIPAASSWNVLFIAFALALLKLESVASLKVQLSRRSSISNRPSKVFRNVEDQTNLKLRRNLFIATSKPGRQITSCNMLESVHETSNILSTIYTFLSESLVLRNVDLGDIAVSALNAGESAAHFGLVLIPTEPFGTLGTLAEGTIGTMGTLGESLASSGTVSEGSLAESSLTSIVTAAASIDFNAIFTKAATTGKAGKKLN
jgi:hypothetical protein